MKIGIIGGGASGMMAAISAASHGAEVTILEGGDRVGRKILATGNGKCNFTNSHMENTCFRSNSTADISPFLAEFGHTGTLAFFESLGMLYKNKNGYFYPASEQASTVLDVLRFKIEEEKAHIKVLTDKKARALTYQKNGSVKVMCGTECFVFDRVILACGSKASPKTGSDGSGYQLIRSLKCGCDIIDVVPALVQLRCKETYLKSVSGVRTEGRISLRVKDHVVYEESGEIQLTEYGVSGIPVFQLSRFASYACMKGERVSVTLDFMPGQDEETLLRYLLGRKDAMKDRTAEQFYAGLLNKKLCMLLGKLAGISPEQSLSEVPEEAIKAFVGLLKKWTLTVDKPNGFDMAQVCAGGLSMAEINAHFCLKKCPSVYVCGELLDVDAICGGYNLQWAWTSGYLAGKYASLD